MTRQVAGIMYTTPDQIPAGLKRVALIGVAAGEKSDDLVQWEVTPYQAGTTIPDHMLKVGCVAYYRGAVIPDDMLKVGGTTTLFHHDYRAGQPGDWTLVDTESKVSFAATTGLTFAGGKASPGHGDPMLIRNFGMQRLPWLLMVCGPMKTANTGTYGPLFTLSSASPTLTAVHRLGFRDTATFATFEGETPLPTVANVNRWLAILFVPQSSGYKPYYYVSYDGITAYLVHIGATVTDTTALYPAIYSYNAACNGVRCWAKVSARPAVRVASAGATGPTISLGEDIVLNGNMETGDPPSNWAPTASATLDGVADERTGGSGAQALDIATTADLKGVMQNISTTQGTWYQYKVWLKRIGNYTVWYGLNGIANLGNTTSTAWVEKTSIHRATETSQQLVVFVNGGASQFRVDDFSAQPITFSSTLTGGGDAGTKFLVADRALTVPEGHHGGIVVCLDSASNPLYYLHAYVDRSAAKAYLLKVENGTTTELVSGSITYGNAKVLRLVVVPGAAGNEVTQAKAQLYYDGTAVGTAQTIDLSSYGTLVREFGTDATVTGALSVGGEIRL